MNELNLQAESVKLLTQGTADPGYRNVFTNPPNAGIIMCINIFENGTQRDVYYILNFTDT